MPSTDSFRVCTWSRNKSEVGKINQILCLAFEMIENIDIRSDWNECSKLMFNFNRSY